jgi:hypothetical protein
MPGGEGLTRQVSAISCYIEVANAMKRELVVVPFSSRHDYGETNNTWTSGQQRAGLQVNRSDVAGGLFRTSTPPTLNLLLLLLLLLFLLLFLLLNLLHHILLLLLLLLIPLLLLLLLLRRRPGGVLRTSTRPTLNLLLLLFLRTLLAYA